ncbi:4-hydroxy-tetrahydrodipicolinate reductase [Nonomuraea longispora]|uniref:4-hydroxy-tetrahydrodipicolinate reductase n=1 Tax=Nonomuraea longispora TaxID=1848320 RepID=A0A4V2XLB3_9ACTN|nr:4-hydroxy-tetrahydrodipicolinate reductase [Nonomuraea longispora]TDC09366.1 4-hydroxy-tetrahydrodipicolinate reductase [Nonomuraea longispora]
MSVRVCVSGATGWTGRAVAAAVIEAPDLELVSAVSRSAAGSDLGAAWGQDTIGVPVHGRLAEALDDVDVVVDYTSHETIRAHTIQAIEHGVHVVVGSSGLSARDLEEIDEVARMARVGVFAGGNFSLGATVLTQAALLAAQYLRTWEIVDYASQNKPDAPSGTARELAERLAEHGPPTVDRPVADTGGHVEARGATVAGTQVHSLRLPSYELATEVIFGGADERLVIRHESGHSAEKFVAGTLHAIRSVPGVIGVVRGLDPDALAQQA